MNSKNGIDGRRHRFRALIGELSTELGGFDGLSLFDRTSVRNVVAMKLRLERLRGDATASADELTLLSGAVRRIQESLIKRANA